jgi:ribosomal protein S18 acetylase RimI-like enzyme
MAGTSDGLSAIGYRLSALREVARVMMPLAIGAATDDDLPAMKEILEEARGWLAENGIVQWTTPFGDEWLLSGIAGGEFCVARLAEAPVAVVRLLWADALFWGGRERGDAAYLHTLAVRRAYAGQGFGKQVVDWAAAEARARGRRHLRLDCVAENRRLGDFYRELGFAACGTATVGSAVMLLFEKDLER